MPHRAAMHRFLGARRSAHIKALILSFALCVLAGLVLFIWGQLHTQAEQSRSQAALLSRGLEDQTGKTLETGEGGLAGLSHKPGILSAGRPRDRESVGEGKRGDLGGRR